MDESFYNLTVRESFNINLPVMKIPEVKWYLDTGNDIL